MTEDDGDVDLLSRNAFDAQMRNFITDWPLFSEYRVDVLGERIPDRLTYPKSVSATCPQCEDASETTWVLSERRGGRATTHAVSPISSQVRACPVGHVLTYNCQLCQKTQMAVWVLRTVRLKQRPVEEGTGSNTVLSASFSKLGQTPPPSIDPPKGMRQAFKDKPQVLDFYKKGLMTLSHGLGLGAVGYFRRVVEESTEELLTLIYEEASQREDEETTRKIDRARREKNARAKLKIAADALPPSLRPGNVNPLNTLWAHLSVNLHGKSDAECLRLARELRDSLEFVFESLRELINRARKYAEDIQTLAGRSPDEADD